MATELEEAETGKPIRVGSFTLDFVRVAHSIPDCVAVVLETDAGRSSIPATGSSTTPRLTG